MTAAIAGMVLPGYNAPASWSGTTALAHPGLIKALGFNWVAIQTSYNTDNWTSTNVTTANAMPGSVLGPLFAACRNAGLKVMYKPHCIPSDGGTQSLHIPGAQFTRQVGVGNSSTQDGHYNSGANTLTSTYISLDTVGNKQVGDRVVCPAAGHTNEIPNSGYADQWARGAVPTWTTVTSITDATHLVMSANATATSVNGVAAILHDADAATWWTAWTNAVMADLATAKTADPQGIGFDMVDMGTEFDWNWRYYPDKGRTLASTIKASYPNILILMHTGNALSYQGDLPGLDVCDYIGCSIYPSVGSSAGGDPQYSVRNAWDAPMATLAAYSNAWGKQILMLETGALSCVGAAYNPSVFGGRTVQRPAVDQASYIESMLYAVWYQPWCAGFFWWNWFGPTQTTDATSSYAPQPQGQSVFSGFLPSGTYPNRFSISGGKRYRRTH
jgi:hypothetical protein